MKLQKFYSTKSFWNLPCAHRQWRHPGHCSKVHGYSRSFHFLFLSTSGELDGTGFVMDFSELKELKAWLEEYFDHTLLLCEDDPLLPQFRDIESQGGAKIKTLPYGVSMEGTARFVYDTWAPKIREYSNGNVELMRVEVKENDKNSGIFEVELI